MQKKQVPIIPSGMQQDLTVAQFPSDAAYEIRNMRVITTGDNTSLCLVNEKGNSKVEEFNGTVLGVQVINDYAIVFSKVDATRDSIDKVYLEDGKLRKQHIFDGNLGFSVNSPIESIGIYETENIQKVYWVDGINQPRVINVSERGISHIKADDVFQFDFLLPVLAKNDAGGIEVSVSKENKSGGNFPSGVVQYAISYYNLYGQQTGLIYQSPLLYAASVDRGISPENKSTDAFSITINNLNTNFDYIRIYRIIRTSLDATVSAVILRDIRLDSLKDKNEELTVFDNGVGGTSIDPTELLYLGSEPFKASTITHKDNTMFLGNITLDRKIISQEIKESIKRGSSVEFVSVDLQTEDNKTDLDTQYNYINHLNQSSKEITFFQKGETYRVGIQLLHRTGAWSDVIWLGDINNTERVVPNRYNDGVSSKPVIKAVVDLKQLGEDLKDYIGGRLVCVFPEDNEREVLCQGLVLPTVYNVKDRVDNAPYVQSSWFARPSFIESSIFDNITSNMGLNLRGLKGFPLEYRMSTDKGIVRLPLPSKFNSEIQYGRYTESNPTGVYPLMVEKRLDRTQRITSIEEDANNFGVDKSIVTFHSPEIDDKYADWIYNTQLDNVKFRIVGYAPVKTTLSDLSITVENPFNPYIGKFYKSPILDPAVSSKEYSDYTHISGLSLNSFPFWIDSAAIKDNDYQPSADKDGMYTFASFPIYPWHRSGSLNNQGNVDEPDKRKSVLKHKEMSNLRISLPTRYLKGNTDLSISNIELFNSDQVELRKLKVWGKEVTYYGNIDKVLTATANYDQQFYYYSRVRSKYPNMIEEANNDRKVNPGELITNEDFALSNTYNAVDNIESDTGNLNKIVTDPVSMRYKSSPHAVFAFNKDADGFYTLLPQLDFGESGGGGEVDPPDPENPEDPDEEEVSLRLIVDIRDRIHDIGQINSDYDNSYIGHFYMRNNGVDYYDASMQFTISEGWKISAIDPYIYGPSTWAYESPTVQHKFYINGDVWINTINTRPSEDTNYGYGYHRKYNIPQESQSNVFEFRTGTTENQWRESISKIEVEAYRESDPDKKYTFILNFRDKGYNYESLKPYIAIKDFQSNWWTVKFLVSESGTQVASTKSSVKQGSEPSDGDETFINPTPDGNGRENLLWENTGEEFIGLKQGVISVDSDNYDTEEYGSTMYYYLIGELYRDKPTNKFGGTEVFALASNTWIPCGDTVYFNNPSEDITFIGDQGDTYFERYDHLKTYPWAKDVTTSTNNMVDIVSFCCETRINIDGRYDKNRGQQSNLAVFTDNFNLFNKVYSQTNNFFNYNYLDSDKFPFNYFPTQVTWSRTKTLGEEIDTWTNITLANVLDLDGDRGDLRALRRFNNEIFSFQDTGISRILFNSRVQMNASDGVPIEIANSGKVDGKVYLSSKYGCRNKWSIVETPSGLYFVDDLNRAILYFGEGITDITYSKNMFSWINKNVSLGVWNPSNFNSIRTLYDSNNGDIYFTTDKEALAFSERLGRFSSFYDYNNVGWMFNLQGNTYQIRDKELWKLHGNDEYNSFFGEKNSEYSVSVIANPEFQLDKIFDTFEFRTNGTEQFSYGVASKYPFSRLVTENEYQKAESTVTALKKKFRVWRWQIGRNSKNGVLTRERIRNPWSKITMYGNSADEVRLYDTAVTYYT